MKKKNEIFLPGGFALADFLISNVELNTKSILIIGFGAEDIARKFSEVTDTDIHIIVDNDESLMVSRLKLLSDKSIKVRFMDYNSLDFQSNKFDIVFAQGSISSKLRKKILAEIRRVLKPDGNLCTGEVFAIIPQVPKFVLDIWERGNIQGLDLETLKQVYTQLDYEIIYEKDLSFLQKDFYREMEKIYKSQEEKFSDNEKSFYKKLLNKISHETKAYLSQGGDKYIGFYGMICKKGVK
jgi:ubiquinone/menaquinone biosynthesis C-methylase UbiE